MESAHGVPVEAVRVGDCPLDDDLNARRRRGAEAMVNAAKCARARRRSLVFGEVEADQVSVFVRDRGSGFDPRRSPPTARGIAESIRGRMQRHGGTAVVRTRARAKGPRWSSRCRDGTAAA